MRLILLRVRGPVASAALHGAAALALMLTAAKAPRLMPVHLPGTANGHHLLLAYSLGGRQQSAASSMPRKSAQAAASKATSRLKTMQTPAAAANPVAEQGSGNSGLTALGDGNVRIAAIKLHPRPEPDLSSLPHGRGGNVILNAVIDTHGTITELTVLQGLGSAIDEEVLATVRGWSFDPATRDGQPIASEQEIVLHYERG